MFTIAVYVALSGLVILIISSCLLKLEPISLRSMVLSAWNCLKSGPASLAFAVLIGSVEAAVTVGGIRERLGLEYGLPNDNVWAHFV